MLLSRLALLGKSPVQKLPKERTNLFWVKVKSGGRGIKKVR